MHKIKKIKLNKIKLAYQYNHVQCVSNKGLLQKLFTESHLKQCDCSFDCLSCQKMVSIFRRSLQCQSLR